MGVPNLTFIFDRKKKSNKNNRGVVEMCIGSGKDRRYISTGVRLLPKEWKDGYVVGRQDWKELNDQLSILRRRCSEIITQMMDEGPVDIPAIPRLLKDSMVVKQTFLEYAKEMASMRYYKISEGTKEHYELFFRFMEQWGGIVYFSDVTEKNVLRMDEALRKKGLKEVSRWNYHKMLKTFVLNAIDDGLVKKNPYARLDIKRGNEEGLKRYLTPAEFHRFESCDIPIERLRRVRDLFVFQTYTMMAYSDLAAFDYGLCKEIDGHTIYKARRQKTGQEFVVVLLPPALTILKRYGGRLPIISNVKYNDYLKSAVTYAKIDKMVTTHWARHTGATMLLNEGHVPMEVIQHILGHASIRETERTYAKLMDETIVKSMVNYHEKYGE